MKCNTPQQLVRIFEKNHLVIKEGRKSYSLRVNKANCEMMLNSRDSLTGKKDKFKDAKSMKALHLNIF